VTREDQSIGNAPGIYCQFLQSSFDSAYLKKLRMPSVAKPCVMPKPTVVSGWQVNASGEAQPQPLTGFAKKTALPGRFFIACDMCTQPQPLTSSTNTNRFPDGSLMLISRLPHGVSSIPGLALR
jgi:hypothetical protein